MITWLKAGDKAWPTDAKARAVCLEEDVYTTIENIALRDGYQPPKSLAYFTPAILRKIADEAAKNPTPKPNGQDLANDPYLQPPAELQGKYDRDDRQWWSRLRALKTENFWIVEYGPKPGEKFCNVPPRVLELWTIRTAEIRQSQGKGEDA